MNYLWNIIIVNKNEGIMSQILVTKTKIEGLYVIEPTVHGDSRGYFVETYNYNDMKEYGLDMVFVQDNQSMSTKGVLRGLHYQKQFPQGKLVRVIKGEVFDVAVDLRSGSDTFGKWFGVVLSADNFKQFYISPGFAHGFLVLSDVAEFCYKVTDFYHPGDEGGLAWNDPDIGIQWPEVGGEFKGTADPSAYSLADGTMLNLSDKDKIQPMFSEAFRF
jgi:dTDP-4-dehydrorhamnose 3,5-epimerase